MEQPETTCSFESPVDQHRGDYIILKGKPCEIVDVAVCKTGKHGSAKYTFTGIDIFTDCKYMEFFMAHEKIQVPTVTKEKYQVLSGSDEDGYFSLLSSDGKTVRNDLRVATKKVPVIPDVPTDGEMYAIVQSAAGLECIIDFKTK